MECCEKGPLFSLEDLLTFAREGRRKELKNYLPYPQAIKRLEKPVMDKHSSLLKTFFNYGHRTFYNIGPVCISVSVT
jgi:hypothetical protein